MDMQIDERFDRIDERFERIENRVERLENQIGQIENRLTNVEGSVESLRIENAQQHDRYEVKPHTKVEATAVELGAAVIPAGIEGGSQQPGQLPKPLQAGGCAIFEKHMLLRQQPAQQTTRAAPHPALQPRREQAYCQYPKAAPRCRAPSKMPGKGQNTRERYDPVGKMP